MLKTSAPTHRAAMVQGSSTFSWASELLPKHSQSDVYALYHWCRVTDDTIDLASDPDQALKEVQFLTEKALYSDEIQTDQEKAYQGLRQAVRNHNIPPHLPLELIQGYTMDVQNLRYSTLQELDQYCYHVAGVVGLMLTPIFGVHSEVAAEQAQSLGMAMQYTNICRDFLEDALRGRVYIPASVLLAAGLDANLPAESLVRHTDSLVTASRHLLSRAESLYAKGFEGLKFLPLQTAFAVAAAGMIYREIGLEILRRGPSAWKTRTYIPRWKMIFPALKGALYVIRGRILK